MLKILKQVEYKGCPIIIRQIDKYRFEYLLVFEGKFYGTFIKNKLKWRQLYRLFLKDSVNNKEIQYLIHFLEKAAETTISTLLKEKELKINKKESRKEYANKRNNKDN